MVPTLYMIPASPPSRAVLMCAKALGVELEIRVLDVVHGELYKDEYLQKNPSATVPILTDDDGFSLWDSHAIMMYLSQKYGNDDSLYSKDLKKRIKVDEKLHFEGSFLFARGAAITRPVIFEGKTKITEEEHKRLQRAYEIVDSFLKNSKYIAGDHMSIADFSYVTSLISWAIFEPIDESRYPNICVYIKRMQRLPYFKECNEEGHETYSKVLKSRLAL